MNSNPHQTAILLVNIGTPDKPTLGSIFQFLSRFLSDPRVIELPQFFWRILLYCLILPIRVFRIKKLYQSIWMPQGSPLKVYTERLCIALQNAYHHDSCYNTDVLNKNDVLNNNAIHHSVSVYYAMTYSNPYLKNILLDILKQPIERLIVLPLFPQYSSTTTGAVWDAVTNILKRYRRLPSFYFIKEYASDSFYLQAVCESITKFWNQHGPTERLLFSFHGIPLRYETLGDPYANNCKTMVRAVAKMLKIPENFYEISFQSRFGLSTWVAPNTQEVLQKFALNGIKSVDVISPSFAVDCLETLEELNVQMRHVFMNAGGERFRYIPALNDDKAQVDALKRVIEKKF